MIQIKYITMKKLILLITLFTGIGFVANAQKPAEFKFTSAMHDFGKIAKDKPVTYEFTFINNGDVPLIIKDAVAQCGCTTPILVPAAGTPIKKGQKGVIRVTFNAQVEGQFTKLVTLNSNAVAAPTMLTIKGEVLPTGTKVTSTK